MTPLSITRTKVQSLLFILVLACAMPILGAPGDVDPGFNPILTSTVTGNFNGRAVLQPDGKWILLGDTSNDTIRFVQRVNPDGTIDPTFDCPSCVYPNTGSGSFLVDPAAAVQADGKILVSHSGRLIRVNSNGSLDTTFRTNFHSIKFLFALPGGKVLILIYFPDGPGQGEAVRRLNSDGTPDPTFNQIELNSLLRQITSEMIVQPDGKMLLAGRYAAQNNDGFLKRYNADGTLDATFSASPNNYVTGVAVFPDGRYLVTGAFSSINGVGRARYARLFQDGSVDTTLFIAEGNDLPGEIKILPNGQFYIFTSLVNPPSATTWRFVRHNNDGTVDTSFSQTFPNPSGYWEVDTEGRIVTMKTISGQSRYFRLNFDGSTDTTFNPIIIVRGTVKAAALQSDGKIVIVGAFEKANGVTVTSPFIRLNSDGTTDTTFNAGTGFNMPPDELAIQPDGKILACGSFAGYNGTWRSNLARINTDGSVDTSFNATIDNRVRACAGLPDGKVLIGGDFTTINGVTQRGLARLNSDGSLDGTFTPVFAFLNSVYDILVQSDASFLVGGYFSGVNGVNTQGVARFLSNGNVDTGFVANAQRTNAIVPSPGGKYMVVTRYVNGNDSSEIFKLRNNGSRDVFRTRPSGGGLVYPPGLLVQPNGNVVYNGSRYIDRVGPNGEEDIFFPTFGANNYVTTFINQPDGKIIVAGAFSGIEDVGRPGIARLTLSNRIRATPFDYDNDGRSDISVFRPSTNTWYEILSGTWSLGIQTFGASGDMIVPADYDADGRTDLGVFRPSLGNWLYIASATNTLVQRHWGTTGDVPLPADVDADGTSEMIVYRPSTGQWFWSGSSGNSGITFGLPGDLPLRGDFDGDGKSDSAIFRPSNGDWWYASSSANYTPRAAHWGQNGDIPVPADYDGDSITDFAIFRPSDGGWYIYNSSNGSYIALQFGLATDRPAPGDYDGDGRADLAIFRPSTGIWYLYQSTSGFAGLQFGISGDVPTPSAFLQ